MSPAEFQKMAAATDLIQQNRKLKNDLIEELNNLVEQYKTGSVNVIPRAMVEYGVSVELAHGWEATLITDEPNNRGFDILRKDGKRGCKLPIHYHDMSEKTIVVVNGTIKVETESATVILHPMQSFHLKNNTPHTITAITDCSILSIFKPPIVI